MIGGLSGMRRILVACALIGFSSVGVESACAQTSDRDVALGIAREAARANRHEEAIVAYRRAIEADPKNRRLWLPDLADQLTWSGRLDDAIALYREVSATDDPIQQQRGRTGLARALSWRGDHSGSLAEYNRLLASDPADREARLGRARVLSWSHRHHLALDEYQALATDAPNDIEAARGIGRVQSWRGRHRAAAAQMQVLLKDHPNDRQATSILAESLRWMGRPDRAERVLRTHVAKDSRDERAATLLEDIEFYQQPDVRIDLRESHQSNDLRIGRLSVDSTLYLADGRSSVSPRYESAIYDPDGSSVDRIKVDRAGIKAQHRFSNSLEWHGGLFTDSVDTSGTTRDDHYLTWDTYASFWPNDLLRFDLGSSRKTFDSEQALRNGLTATRSNLSMDILPSELARVSARYSWTEFSDRNERNWWQFEVERRVRHRPRLALGYRYTGFDFSVPGMRGYYNPARYNSHEVLLQSWGRFSDWLRWSVASTVGYEVADLGDNRVIWSADAALAWDLARGFELEAAYDHFSSRTASIGGFERGTGRLTLRRVF